MAAALTTPPQKPRSLCLHEHGGHTASTGAWFRPSYLTAGHPVDAEFDGGPEL